MKKNRILAVISLAACLFNMSYSNAQVNKIKTVRNMMSAEDINILAAKYNIDLAYENSQTSNSVDMWAWRAMVYSYIGYNLDTAVSNLDLDATKKAGESFSKYYQFSEEDRANTKEEVANFYTQAASLCFNKSIQLSSTKGQFNDVKLYIGYVETILSHDETALLEKQNITLAKLYLILLQSSQKDSLVDEEVNYLNKLVAIPKYNNAYVFVRLSEIYVQRKEYDKALEVLAKGKEKIPSKAGDFLNAEIALEIDRNNIASLIAKFNEGIAQDPENALYYYNRGTTYAMLKNKEIEDKVEPGKYYFIQGLSDFRKSLSIDPSNQDASFNEASLLVDSANYLYKLKTKVAGKYDLYDKQSKALYKEAIDKLELIRQSGSKKDNELIDLLKTMRSICSKIGDDEGRKKYNTMYLEEETKMKNSNQ